jgi:DNA-binding beta-propeller fold protein YncE
MSVIIVAYKSVTAQSIETNKGPIALDQLQVGGDPESIAVNTVTNKIYTLNPTNSTVTVIDSKSGTVKNIPVGLGYSFYKEFYNRHKVSSEYVNRFYLLKFPLLLLVSVPIYTN